MGYSTQCFVRGTSFTVEFLVLPDGTVPARAFFEGITPADQQYRRKIQLEAAIKTFADLPQGRFLNRERFKELDDGIFEFKAHQLRLFCFYQPGGRLILAFGVVKKTDKHDPPDMRRAVRYRDEYVAECSKDIKRRKR